VSYSIEQTVVGTNLQTAMEAVLMTGAGWTKSGSTYTNPVGADRVMSFTLTALTAASWQITVGSRTFYIYTGATSLSGNFKLTVIAGPTHVYISCEGPAEGTTGAADATYGSTRSFFCMTALVPYYASDTTLVDLQVAFSGTGANASNTPTEKAYIKTGLDGTAWAPGEFLTLKPMVQGIAAVGSQINQKFTNQNILYPMICFSEDVGGLRGRLDNIFYGGEKDIDAGDASNYAGFKPQIDGAVHFTVQPFFVPNVANMYSPLGVPTKSAAGAASSTNDGGPFIAVKG
jgi:hypothetical protein